MIEYEAFFKLLFGGGVLAVVGTVYLLRRIQVLRRTLRQRDREIFLLEHGWRRSGFYLDKFVAMDEDRKRSIDEAYERQLKLNEAKDLNVPSETLLREGSEIPPKG
jgi:hypothetical protein